MATKKQVIHAWVAGDSAATPNGSLHTDGSNLFSYRLKIGYKETQYESLPYFSKVVLDYTTPAGWFQSSTTSTHVGLAKQYADKVELPS